MVKVCAVLGCQSGRGKYRRERQGLGLRQIALFSIPKCNNRRSQWSKALGFELKANHNVCQYHFSEESIHKFDKILLTDGTVYESPLVPWRLTQDAVPISRNDESMDCKNNNVVKEEPPTLIPIITSPAMATAPSIDDAVEKRSPINSPIILKPAIETVPPVPPEPCVGEILSNVERPTAAFTMGLLKDVLNTELMPESWAWTQKSSGVVFTLVGQSNFHSQLHLEVDLNLSLQVRTSTNKVISLINQVESMEDIRQCLKILNKVEICSGTGIESESHHPRCMGILDDNKSGKFRRRNLRCMLCQCVRRTLQKREERRTKSARRRNQKLRKADLARKKFVRLQRKNEKLRSNVADLRRKCSSIQRETWDSIRLVRLVHRLI